MKTLKCVLIKCLPIILFFLFVISSYGLIVDVLVDRTFISDGKCGGTAPVKVSIINRGTDFGVLCWWSTDLVNWNNRGTSSCVFPNGGSTSFDAHLDVPLLGSVSRNLFIACRNYGYTTFFGLSKTNTCTSGLQWWNDYATGYPKDSKPPGSGCYAINGVSDDDCLFTQAITLVCPNAFIEVTPSEERMVLNDGEERAVSVHLENQGDNPLSCYYQGEAKGQISPSSTTSFDVMIKAPSIGSGTTSTTIEVLCTDTTTNKQISGVATITIIYSPNPCNAKIETATIAYNNAVKKNTEADAALQGADSRCGSSDKTEAIGFKNQVESFLSTAKSALENARKTCSNGDISNGINQADDAKNKAEQAISYATQAKNAIEKAVTECLSGRKEASDLLSQIDSKIRSCESWIERADSVVKNGTDLGMDTHQQKADVETARSAIADTKAYQQQASTYFDSKDYSMTKKDAKEAITKAENAETSAMKAYNSLYKSVEDANTAKNELGTAATEIAKADQIFAKLAVVVRAMKENSNVTSTEVQINELRSNIESARDYSSQAQNKFSAGYFEESVNLATRSRDTAASANNRLSRLVEGFTVTVIASLEKVIGLASSEVDASNSKIKEASATYVADGDKIKTAGESMQAAKIALNDAKGILSKIKTTTDLTEFLNLASNGFNKVKIARQKASDAKMHAENAINLGYAYMGATVAGGIGLGGAGFLFWRRKNSNNANDDEEANTKVKTERHLEPITSGVSVAKTDHNSHKEALECPKCGVLKENMGAKFCEECGSSLRKKVHEHKPLDACIKCGEKVTHKTKFCSNCGEKTQE